MKQTLEPIVAAVLEPIGYELVELRVGGSRARPVLDIRIDRKDHEKVAVEDCAKASRAIEERLDATPVDTVADPVLASIAGRYVLEVSSPGIERALRTLADWRRFAGRRAMVKSKRLEDLGGRAELEIVGVSDGAPEHLVVRDLAGHERTLTLADVDDARLTFHWNS